MVMLFLTRCVAGRLAVLAILLFCLCCSRGEGLHLLPFVEKAGSASEMSPVGRPASYQYSVDPHNASALKHSTKKTHADSQTPAEASRITALGPRIAEISSARVSLIVVAAPSKFELTSSSDRSPPLAKLS